MMEVIVVVYAAFGLAASDGKTEIMCSRTKGMPEATTIFGVEALNNSITIWRRTVGRWSGRSLKEKRVSFERLINR